MNMTLLWLVLAIALFIIEGVTVGMVCMWFGIGAVVSMLVSLATDSIYIQWLVFIVVSLVMLVLLRPMAKKAMHSHIERTNAGSMIGKMAVLTQSIGENSPGRLKYGDVSWIAVTDNGDTIEKGEKVSIVSIEGNKLVVSKI